MKNASILVVEDDADLAESLRDILEAERFTVTVAGTGAQGMEQFRRGDYALVLTDFRLPECGGLELIDTFRNLSPLTPVILMTAHGTSDLAIEAVQRGAFDYLIKPFKTQDLVEILRKAAQSSRMSSRKVSLGTRPLEGKPDVIIGQSRKMQAVYREIGKVANKNVTVLIQGETGTGKEMVARAVYHHSDRAGKPFIAVNCTAIPENLLESELFGHERGSFTGAVSRRIGRFEQAHGGTLFLDEIGDMTHETQVKMLRVLQDKTIRRVGGDHDVPVDVRVITATHQNLEEAVAEGRFREDLYYRINTAIIDLPPLRERENDIELLVAHFLALYCREFGAEHPKLDPGSWEALTRHAWPGNVRELENVVRRIIIMANGFPISREEVRALICRSSAHRGASENSDLGELGLQKRVHDTLARARDDDLQNPWQDLITGLEREMIYQSLELCQGNQSAASKLLGLSRVTFREKMEKFGMLPKKKDNRPVEKHESVDR